MLYPLLVVLYFVVCVFLILVVLLQTGKRADLAGAFGGGGSQSAFGTRGAATALTKATTGAAIVFMLIALVLSLISRNAVRSGSVLDEVDASSNVPAATEPASAPPVPGAADLPPTSDTPTDTGNAPPGSEKP